MQSHSQCIEIAAKAAHGPGNIAPAKITRTVGIDADPAAQSGHPGRADAPAQALHETCGITRAAIVARAMTLLHD